MLRQLFLRCGSACWSVTLTCFRFLEDGPRPTRVRSFIGRAGSVVQLSVTTRAPENTRSSNDGDGSGGGGRGDGSNGSAAHLLRKTIPTFYLILARSFALSLSQIL